MTMQNKHTYVKPERVDTSYYPSYHQPRPPPPNVHNPLVPHTRRDGVGTSTQQKTIKPVVTEKNDTNIENLPDFPSIKGVFGWTTIDDVNIPYILRSDKQFVSVRIVEMKLLSRYPNSYPDDLGKHAPLTSFFITENEAKLLNEINIQHCDGDYGKKTFNTKDLIVLLSDFIKFYELVKKTFPDAKTARVSYNQAGWLQIKNTVTPYLSRNDGKYVPLSVIQYAAGLLTNDKVNSVSPTKQECDALNNACKQAGVEFTFSEANRLIKIKDLLRISPVDIISLPSSNPLKHATYMELPTKNGSKVESKPTSAPKTQQPYRFQPNANLDVLRLPGQGKSSSGDQNERVAREQHVTFPPQMQGIPMIDPRLAAMYRHPYGIPRMGYMPTNQQSPHMQQGPMFNPLTQYYMPLQQGSQGPPNQQAPPGGVIPGRDMHSRSPGSSSSNNPSPRSRPPSQSRPPSASRPPSQPSVSPLSPTQLTARNTGYPTLTEIPLPQPHTSLPPPPAYPNLHQIQAMFQQRFPVHFPQSVPPPAHQQPVSPKQSHGPGEVNGNPPLPSPSSGAYNSPGSIPQIVKPTTHPKNHYPNGVSSKPDAQKSPGRPPGGDVGGPPPLILMAPTTQQPAVPKNDLKDSNHAVNTTSHEHDQTSAVHGSPPVASNTNPANVTPVTPVQTVTVSTTKQKSPYVDRIQGAWLNNKSISCLHLETVDREGRYCLVEAVCKLYFNGCSVNEFLFALEKVLNVPLLTCDDDEEKAFIQYYNLPVDVLKCNKMIKFDDLETFFPQLSYMFPDKNATELLLGQEASDTFDTDNNNMSKLVSNGVVVPEELVDSMPMTIGEMGEKRKSDLFDADSTKKKLRMDDTEEDAVIILD